MTNKIDQPDAAAAIPPVLRVSAALAWRLLVLAAALYVLGVVVGQIYEVVIPVAIALLLAALLAPLVSTLCRRNVPRGLATAIVLIGGLAAVGGVLSFVINAFIAGFPSLQTQVLASLTQLRGWLAASPLHIGDVQLNHVLEQARDWLQANQSTLTNGLLNTAGTFGSLLTGLVLALFTLIYFLYDGRQVWLFVIKLIPSHVRDRVDGAGIAGFNSLVAFVRATAVVAVVDAIGIGTGVALLGVPLAVPLSALVFLGCFIPIVGAIASGSVAVLIALVTKGWVVALIVLGVVLVVQQIEGNVLQPLILGRAVHLHALGVVLVISVGVVVNGIVGALLAVPIVAVLNSAIRSLTGSETPAPEPEIPASPEPPEQEDSDEAETPPEDGKDA